MSQPIQHTVYLSPGQMKTINSLYPTEQNIQVTQCDLLTGGDHSGHLMVSLVTESGHVHIDREGNIVKDAR